MRGRSTDGISIWLQQWCLWPRDLEVTLRNTIHDRLTDHFDRPDWWGLDFIAS